MAAPKPNMVEIWLFRGKNIYLKKTNGKVFGGIVSFKEADPTKPVVWLGQQSYAVMNMSNKKTVLFYDTLNGMLFKPKDMSNTEDSVDMVMQTSQNVLLAGKEAKQALGIEENKTTVFNFALALIVIMAVIFIVFLYLFYENPPARSGATTTAGSSTPTGGLIPGGPSLVPTTSITKTISQNTSTTTVALNRSIPAGA